MFKYTKEQLIFYLRKLSSELKRTPTVKDINKSEYPSSTTYIKRFGSWNKTLLISGLKINVKKSISKKDLIDNLKIIEKEIGRIPQPKDLKERRWAGSYSTYIKNFKSWKKAISESGLIKPQISNLKKFARN